jgi:hypothetical protein
MGNLKRLSLVTALALAAVALAAGSASADIQNSSGTYVGEFQGVNTGDNPTLVAGNSTVTCTSALVGGFDLTASTINGDWNETGPASGNLDFRWSGCSVVSGVQFETCTVDDVLDVDVAITELNAPDSTVTNTETAGTLISCGLVFNCTATADVSTTPVTAEVDFETQIASIDDTVSVSGIGCPTSGQWRAQYAITVPEDDLFATGSM